METSVNYSLLKILVIGLDLYIFNWREMGTYTAEKCKN